MCCRVGLYCGDFLGLCQRSLKSKSGLVPSRSLYFLNFQKQHAAPVYSFGSVAFTAAQRSLDTAQTSDSMQSKEFVKSRRYGPDAACVRVVPLTRKQSHELILRNASAAAAQLTFVQPLTVTTNLEVT